MVGRVGVIGRRQGAPRGCGETLDSSWRGPGAPTAAAALDGPRLGFVRWVLSENTIQGAKTRWVLSPSFFISRLYSSVFCVGWRTKPPGFCSHGLPPEGTKLLGPGFVSGGLVSGVRAAPARHPPGWAHACPASPQTVRQSSIGLYWTALGGPFLQESGQKTQASRRGLSCRAADHARCASTRGPEWSPG